MKLSLRLIPATIQVIIQNITEKCINSEMNPVAIEVFTDNFQLVVESGSCRKLIVEKHEYKEFQTLNRAYLFYTGKEIELEEKDIYIKYTIPLIQAHEE